VSNTELRELVATRPGHDLPAVIVRPIGPDDSAELERFYERLSEDSRHLRFFAVTRGLSRAQSTSFCSTDHDHREGFVATTAAGGSSRIVGHVCLEPAGEGRAEVAIAVADELQCRGIGRRLMVAAFDWARWANVDTLVATMLTTNVGIHRLVASLGVPCRFRPAGFDAMTVEITVPGAGAAAA
jgi:RimJ/RimL family protein N-acetyltransferase